MIDAAIGIIAYESATDSSRVHDAERLQDLFDPLVSKGTHVFVDDGTLGCGPNAARAWRWCAEQDSLWSIVLSDDAVPCRHIDYALGRILNVARGKVLTFMDWTKASEEAKSRGVHWVRSEGNLYGVGVAIPTVFCRDMLRWINGHYLKALWEYNADDAMIATWMRARGIKAWHPVPTPFQHGRPSDSTLGHSNRTRVCRWTLVDSEIDPYEIDWKVGFNDPVVQRASRTNRAWAAERFRLIDDWWPAKRRSDDGEG